MAPIGPGSREEVDPKQTALATGLGAGAGAGIVKGGEVISKLATDPKYRKKVVEGIGAEVQKAG